jgi:hypothetical protein
MLPVLREDYVPSRHSIPGGSLPFLRTITLNIEYGAKDIFGEARSNAYDNWVVEAHGMDFGDQKLCNTFSATMKPRELTTILHYVELAMRANETTSRVLNGISG